MYKGPIFLFCPGPYIWCIRLGSGYIICLVRLNKNWTGYNIIITGRQPDSIARWQEFSIRSP